MPLSPMQERKLLAKYTDELRGLMPERVPYGITVKPDRKTRNILVGNDKLAFCVTWEACRDGLHTSMFPQAFAELVKALETKK